MSFGFDAHQTIEGAHKSAWYDQAVVQNNGWVEDNAGVEAKHAFQRLTIP